MRKRSMLVVVCALGGLAIAACEKNDNQSRSEPSQQPVTTTNATSTSVATTTSADLADPIAGAENAAKVKQTADETKFPAKAVSLTATTVTVRTEPFGGDEVLRAKSGLQGQEVARSKDYYLILFADPKDEAKTMAGWVYKDALDDHSAKTMGAVNLQCKTPAVHILADHDFCGNTCRSDDDCKKVGGVCDGQGKIAMATGGSTEGRYCVGAGQ